MTSSNVCSLLVTSSHNLASSTWLVQGSPRSGAHCRSLLSFTTFYSSADPLLHRRPATNGQGRPHDALLSLAVGGFIQSLTEAKLASMNLKSPGFQVQHAQVPPPPALFSTSAPNRQSSAFNSSSSSYLPIPPISSAT